MPPKPARGFAPTPTEGASLSDSLLRFAAVLTVSSMLMGWLMRVFRFEPISIAECFAFCSETASLLFFWGVTLGCCPNLLGDIVPKPLLRFAAVLTVDSMLMGWLMRVFRFKPVSIAECFAFCSETTSLLFFLGLRWAAAQTRLGTLSPNPFFASRRF